MARFKYTCQRCGWTFFVQVPPGYVPPHDCLDANDALLEAEWGCLPVVMFVAVVITMVWYLAN